ncbi:MAG TPA: ribosome maturation factor RimM [Pyrinomonadaceae bacterium]|nr:ribosome maturation factor RimM [Pyrinomonadaceae bacterium]
MNHGVEENRDLVIVARAVRTRGLKGELVAELLTDFPERFESLEELIAVSPDGERQTVKLENFWFQNGRVILKIESFDDVDSARVFIGFDFAVPEAERVQLEADEYYDWELEGCTVSTVDGDSVGIVSSIMKTGGTEILVVSDSEVERLVPLAASIVKDIDRANKRILIDPPPGLFEL